jgi:dTDP-4-amino-4,6-dideoxygalactose transaminase
MIRFNKPTIEKKDLESVLYCMIEDDLLPGGYLEMFTDMLSGELGLPNVLVFNNYFHVFESIFNLLQGLPGNEIILPSFARHGILWGIKKCGLHPVLVDIEPDSFLPSFSEIEKKINKNTCCIFVQQLFGIPNDLSRYHGFELPLIEDIDGSLGSTVNGKPVGSFGTFVTMSFNDYAILTTGNGGLLASSDRRIGGLKQTLKNDSFVIDYLMSDFNASLGISQLKKLQKILERRRKIGEYYDNAVMASGCSLVGRDDDKVLSYSSYVVKTRTPFNDCVRFFKRYGIPIRRGIETPLHNLLDLETNQFCHTEEMYHRIVALPIYPTLIQEDIENVVKGIKSILS